MYARVARWEEADADALRASAKEMADNVDAGPPPGVPAKGFTMLIDPDSGTSLAIALFETEEDLRTGDEALNNMNPSSDDTGKRTSVESYEVSIDVRL
jgi:hypothetical protein